MISSVQAQRTGSPDEENAPKARAQLRAEGVDVEGSKWKIAVVEVTPGGK